MARFATALIFLAISLHARQVNFKIDLEPCSNAKELLSVDHMKIGVRFDLTTPLIERQFKRALDFWQEIIDFQWYEVHDNSCALSVTDASKELLQNDIIARAHLPSLDNFQGWIIVDPEMPTYMDATEIYSTCVHELGHIFGLMHTHDARSVMYPIDCNGTEAVEPADMVQLARHHRLRETAFKTIRIIQ